MYSLRIGFCAYGVRTDSGLLSVRFWGTKKAPIRVLMNKKTISNTHFSMGKIALQSQKCAVIMPIIRNGEYCRKEGNMIK